jgi:hypothetical protein
MSQDDVRPPRRSRAGIGRRVLPGLVALLALSGGACPSVQAQESGASRQRQLARIQLHRNGNRGVAYLPRATADGSSEPATFTLQPRRVIPTPGDPLENVRANVHPIDVDGDGFHELLQINGYRFMRVFGQGGDVLWSLRNPAGRVHRTETHRDTLAILDVDGDRRQEIVHCWVDPGSSVKRLVVRRGDTGAVLRRHDLTGDPAASECQIAAFHVPTRATPLILVSRQMKVQGNRCPRMFVDLWPITAAFDTELRPLWRRRSCDAGHYAWPLDENADGAAEAVFIGRYLFGPEGALRCTLPGWGSDHVDSLLVTDLDPSRAGHEAVAVGATGVRLYAAASCTALPWSLPASITNIQQVNAARTEAEGALAIVMRARNSKTHKIKPFYQIDASGRVVGTFLDDNSDPQSTIKVPMANANLDGAEAAEDLVAWFGQVIDGKGRVRLDTSWYWGLQTLTPAERDLSVYDQWTNAPVVVDLDGDGRDEMITWGRRLIVVGSREPIAPGRR